MLLSYIAAAVTWHFSSNQDACMPWLRCEASWERGSGRTNTSSWTYSYIEYPFKYEYVHDNGQLRCQCINIINYFVHTLVDNFAQNRKLCQQNILNKCANDSR